MNSKTLLTKKRNRSGSKARVGSSKHINYNSPMVQINGFNLIELYYAESIENKNASFDSEISEKNIIGLKEEKTNLKENNENNTEIIEMTRTKAKNIEEYYTSKFGISEIKENCFKCLMANFLSNELLYFNSRKDLFNYIKYCFSTKTKLIFTDEDNLKQNKEKFMNANTSFINGWRFFIPKTICKGCFMEIINMKNLISNIKNIFSDIERDSLCRTNYRNYALFSPRFRAAFRLSKSRNPRRQTRKNNGNNKNSKKNIYNLNNLKNNKNEAKNYNLNVNYEKGKNVLIIDKKILDNSVCEMLKKNIVTKNGINLSKNININNNNKNILNDNYINNKNDGHDLKINLNDENNSSLNKSEFTNNINNITIQGQNNINIINDINKNKNVINNNINYINFEDINQQIKELLNKMKNDFIIALYYLKKIKILLYIILNYVCLSNQKINGLFLYPNLIRFTEILENYNGLICCFYEHKNYLNQHFGFAKKSSEKGINYLNNILEEIQKNNNINLKEKQNLIELIQNLLSFIEINTKSLDKFDIELNRFNRGFLYLNELVKTILCPITK